MKEQAETPSYLADNPYMEILRQRGKDEDPNLKQPPTGPMKQETASVPQIGTQRAQLISAPRRGFKLLEACLQAYELHLQHFNQNEIANTLGITPRQVRNYIQKAKGYFGVPEGLKHAALAEIMLAIRRAWMSYYKTEDPRIKVLWFKAALSAMVHRDRLLGLLADRHGEFGELKQT